MSFFLGKAKHNLEGTQKELEKVHDEYMDLLGSAQFLPQSEITPQLLENINSLLPKSYKPRPHSHTEWAYTTIQEDSPGKARMGLFIEGIGGTLSGPKKTLGEIQSFKKGHISLTRHLPLECIAKMRECSFTPEKGNTNPFELKKGQWFLEPSEDPFYNNPVVITCNGRETIEKDTNHTFEEFNLFIESLFNNSRENHLYATFPSDVSLSEYIKNN